MNRKTIEAQRLHLIEADAKARELIGFLSNLYGKARADTWETRSEDSATYRQQREYWIRNVDWLRSSLLDAFHDTSVAQGLANLEKLFRPAWIGNTVAELVTLEGQEFAELVGRVEDPFPRYAEYLKQEEAKLPPRSRSVADAVGGSINEGADWLEARPKTLILVGIIAAAVVVSLGIISASDLADLIRAIRGG